MSRTEYYYTIRGSYRSHEIETFDDVIMTILSGGVLLGLLGAPTMTIVCLFGFYVRAVAGYFRRPAWAL